MKRSLPEQADLGQLKKQAKELLRDIRAHRAGGIARIHGSAQPETVTLQEAQKIVAREYGFPSWPKLKLHVESRTEETAERALIEAALQGKADDVETLLKETPDLHRRNLYAAAALGSMKDISVVLERDPPAATRKGGPRDWPPILYLCFGRCGGGDAARADAAKKLLEAGADPNTSWTNPTWPESPLPVLYGATGVNNYPRLARCLLEAGADPNDSESLYHAAEHHHVECLEVLKEYGADFSARDRIWKNTPLYFLLSWYSPDPRTRDGIRWLLQNGADPNVSSDREIGEEMPLHAAIRNGWEPEIVSILLDHGADPAIPRMDGRTPYALAVRNGRADIAGTLRAWGVPENVSLRDRFLGACMRADENDVRAAFDQDPHLMTQLAPEDHQILHDAAREGRSAALALMAKIGFDLATPDEFDGATPLHWACLQGMADAVKVLVEKGAPLDPDDTRYHAPPVGWVAHGSLHTKNHDGDYVACARILIAAGAKIPPKTSASEDVMEVLRDHLLRRAIRQGRVEEARALLKEEANPNYLHEDGTVPLHLAARVASPEIVDLLLGHGARNWIPDNEGKLPVDSARGRDSGPDRDAIIELFTQPRIKDPAFKRAVETITTGDLETLKRLLAEHPDLPSIRAEENGEFAGAYFSRPRLLEFVAENPVRSGKLPPNIGAIAETIIKVGAPKESINRTLGLVASGRVPRECGVQNKLIELLVRNGADPSRALDGAINQGEWAATETLLRLGARPGLYAAAGLGREAQVREALSAPRRPSDDELARAADAAIRGGHGNCLQILLEAGVKSNAKVPGDPYSTTLLHLAAWFGRSEIADLLLERGADPHATDTQFRGTPSYWANYAGHKDLAVRLRDAEETTPRRLSEEPNVTKTFGKIKQP